VVVCLAVLHTNPAPAIILALLNALIVYLRRDELASLAEPCWDDANSPTPKNLPANTKRK
jgi:hypothetical protein